jgi:hypothetical protein
MKSFVQLVPSLFYQILDFIEKTQRGVPLVHDGLDLSDYVFNGLIYFPKVTGI